MAHIGGVAVGNAHTQLVLHWVTHCGVGVGGGVHVGVTLWCIVNTFVLCYIVVHSLVLHCEYICINVFMWVHRGG